MVFLVVFNCVSTSDNADLTRYDVCVTDNRRNRKRKDGVVLLHLLRVFLSPREIFSRWDQFLLQSGSLASSRLLRPTIHRLAGIVACTDRRLEYVVCCGSYRRTCRMTAER